MATPGTLQGYRGLPRGIVPNDCPRWVWHPPGVAAIME